MDKILVVEGDKQFSTLIQRRFADAGTATVVKASTMAEAMARINGDRGFALAVLDRNLPDAPNGEILNAVQERGIPAIIVCNAANTEARPEARDAFLERGAIEYLVNDGPGSLEYLTSLVGRVLRHRSTKVMIVDDSGVTRTKAVRALSRFQLNVIETPSGADALELARRNPDLQLVITDFELPGLDGLELVKALRKLRDRDNLAVIGIAGVGRADLSAKFLKLGANDYITKPFSDDELMCRVSLNLDHLANVKNLRAAAASDYLTGLYNRRFFFEAARPVFAQARRQKRNVAVAMVAIDRFNLIGQSAGQETADKVLASVAAALKARARDADILARMDGHEICILLFDAAPEALSAIAGDLLARVSSVVVPAEGTRQDVTASIGICAERLETLDEMIERASALLFRAKESGRNRAIIASGNSRGETVKGPQAQQVA